MRVTLGSTVVALTTAILALEPGTALAADKRPEHLYGPPPSWEQYRQIAEANIISDLFDPGSAQIGWMGTFSKGSFKPFLDARVEGYFACGMINARNRLGGYVGARAFVVVIDYGRVLYSEIDTSTSGSVTRQCGQAQQDGLLPPLPTTAVTPTAVVEAATTSSPTISATTSSGLTLRSMPDGAYISGVTPGSAAGTAGLKPGMVIGSVNAIPLSGMGDAMLKVIEAAGKDATVTVIGGGTIKLGAKR